jgi:16S rRNA (uracil1498-N3)-methyltransferase
VVQALPKSRKIEWVIEKATEIGAASVIPMVTERTVVRPRTGRGEQHLERWRRIAIGAARQCSGAWVPEVREIHSFSRALAVCAGFDAALIATLLPGTEPLADVMARLREPQVKDVALLIGPEGDFSPSEQAEAGTSNCVGVSFGSRVLRSETAAIYGLSVLAYELLRESGA